MGMVPCSMPQDGITRISDTNLLAAGLAILVTIDAMLTKQHTDQERGAVYVDKLHADGLKRDYVKRLEVMGRRVILETAAWVFNGVSTDPEGTPGTSACAMSADRCEKCGLAADERRFKTGCYRR